MTEITHSGDQTTHLKILGKGSIGHQGPPSSSLLETFSNLYPHRPYVITIAFPEYTSLCPVTGQPDFGTIVVEYIPHERCIESKSFKLYLIAFRNHQTFMETVTNTILEDMVTVLDPLWCRVKGLFEPRGATHLHVFAEHIKEVEEKEKQEALHTVIFNWKQQYLPHSWK